MMERECSLRASSSRCSSARSRGSGETGGIGTVLVVYAIVKHDDDVHTVSKTERVTPPFREKRSVEVCSIC